MKHRRTFPDKPSSDWNRADVWQAINYSAKNTSRAAARVRLMWRNFVLPDNLCLDPAGLVAIAHIAMPSEANQGYANIKESVLHEGRDALKKNHYCSALMAWVVSGDMECAWNAFLWCLQNNQTNDWFNYYDPPREAWLK